MNFRVAVFDLDGTLTNPETGIVRCMTYGLAAVGAEAISPEILRRHIGPPLQDVFLQLGVEKSDIDKAVAAYRERFIEVGMFENEVITGIPDVLRKLAANGWRLAVATSKPEQFATDILRHFDLLSYFAAVGGATLDGSRRHKADVIRHTLDELGANPREAVMVGDRGEDVQGAKQHGLRTIAVTWGFGRIEEFNDSFVAAIVDTPSQLFEVLTVESARTGGLATKSQVPPPHKSRADRI